MNKIKLILTTLLMTIGTSGVILSTHYAHNNNNTSKSSKYIGDFSTDNPSNWTVQVNKEVFQDFGKIVLPNKANIAKATFQNFKFVYTQYNTGSLTIWTAKNVIVNNDGTDMSYAFSSIQPIQGRRLILDITHINNDLRFVFTSDYASNGKSLGPSGYIDAYWSNLIVSS